MPETKTSQPLDLSTIEGLEAPLVASTAIATQAPAESQALVANDPRLSLQARPERLVEVANLTPEELAAASASAAKVDFRRTTSLLAHGEDVLSGISQSSRQLLTGVRLGEAGEVGRIAAAVIDGIKILRIQDLQAESSAKPPERKGIEWDG